MGESDNVRGLSRLGTLGEIVRLGTAQNIGKKVLRIVERSADASKELTFVLGCRRLRPAALLYKKAQ